MNKLHRFKWFQFLGDQKHVGDDQYIGNFDGAMELRIQYHTWLEENRHRLLDLSQPTFFLNYDGIPFHPINNNYSEKLGFHKEKLGDYDRILQQTWTQEELGHLRAGTTLHSFFWADGSLVLPVLALLTGTSVVMYHYLPINGGRARKTRLIEYRDDGLVQIHKDFGGFVPPIKNAVVVHYQ
jgi:hypothetical protein